VGIGTTSPVTNLAIAGNAAVTGTLYVNNNFSGTGSGSTGTIQLGDITISKSAGSNVSAGGGWNFSQGISAGQSITTGNNFSVSGGSIRSGLGGSVGEYTTDGNKPIVFYPNNAGSEVMRVDTSGNVGIGTTSPYAKLSVGGAAGGTTPLFGISTSTVGYATTTALTVDQNGNLSLLNGANLAVGGNLIITGATTHTGNVGVSATSTFGSTGQTFIGADGRISLAGAGVIPSNASYALGVNGRLYVSNQLDIGGTWGSSNGSYINNGGDIYFSDGSGHSLLGVPNSAGGIYNLYSGGSSSILALEANANQKVLVNGRLQVDTSGDIAAAGSSITGLFRGNPSQSVDIFNVQNSSSAVLFNVTAAGKVGVGTTSPASTLTVTGSACISEGAGATAACSTTAGTITADVFNTAAADLAERYNVIDPSISPGDVVALDPTQSLVVDKATEGSQIFGIVSTDPGFLLAEDNEDATTTRPIALAGRVPVNVSMENGPISIGDDLTLSSTPGVAMKATATSTAIIGTALQNISSAGQVLVFVRSSIVSGIDISSTATSSAFTLASTDSGSLGKEFANLLSGVEQWIYGKVSASVGFFNDLYANVIHVNSGLEIKDQATGAIYCVTIVNGDWQKTPGACGTSPSTKSAPATSTSSTTSSSIPGTTGTSTAASSTPPTASTTDSTATSTPIVDATSTPDTIAPTATTTLSAPAATTTPLVLPTPTIDDASSSTPPSSDTSSAAPAAAPDAAVATSS
jgi:hypothetical protein